MGRVAARISARALLHPRAAVAARLARRASAWLLAAALALALVGRFSLVAGLLAGLAWAWLSATARTAGDLPPALEGQDLLVRGYVASFPRAAAGDSQFLLDVAEPRAGVPPRIRLVWYRSVACAASRRAVAARRTTQASQRIRQSRRLRLRGAAVSRRHRRDRLCARRRAQRELAPPSLRYAVTARARLDFRSHSRGGARPAGARRSAGSRGRRHAGDDAGAMARVRGDRDDAPDGDLRPAHQHGRGAGRVARRRDRATAVAHRRAAGPRCTARSSQASRQRSCIRRSPGCRCRRSARCSCSCIYFARALVSTRARGRASARPGADRRAADRSVCAARARRVAVVRRGRDHPAGSRRPSAARRTDRSVRAHSDGGHDRTRAAAARSVRQHFADVAARQCRRDSAVHAAHRADGAARSAAAASVWLPAGEWVLAVPRAAAALDVAAAAMARAVPAGAVALSAAAVAAFAALVVGVLLLVVPASGRRGWQACCCACRSLLHRVPVPVSVISS